MVGILLAIVLTATASTVDAQFTHTAHSARSAAMGGCHIYDTARHVTLSYRNTFGITELADKKVSALLPLWTGYVEGEYSHHGNSEYHEQQAIVATTIRATQWLSVTAALRYLNLGSNDPHYARQHWLAWVAGLRIELPHRVNIDLSVGSRQWDTAQPWTYRTTLIYNPSKEWTTIVEALHDGQFRLMAGAEYVYDDVVAVRAGMSTNPLSATFGVGLRRNVISIDIAAEAHSRLGLTPHICITLWF